MRDVVLFGLVTTGLSLATWHRLGVPVPDALEAGVGYGLTAVLIARLVRLIRARGLDDQRRHLMHVAGPMLFGGLGALGVCAALWALATQVGSQVGPLAIAVCMFGFAWLFLVAASKR